MQSSIKYKLPGLLGTVGTIMALVLMPLNLWCETANIDEARQVAQNWLSHMTFQKGTWAGEVSPSIQNAQEIIVDDTLLGYCFSISPDGYIIVPILKELSPVKAYYETTRFDPADNEGIPALIKDVLFDRIRYYIQAYGSLEATQPDTGEVILGRRHRRDWDRYMKSNEEFFKDLYQGRLQPLAEVGPLLSSSWIQTTPYNNYCPVGDTDCTDCGGGSGPSSDITLTGCVATAAAQIMNYWQWPPYGKGSHSYTWRGDTSCGDPPSPQVLSANLSDTYDWANIPDSCDNGCSSADSAALAELCYEVGVTFHMKYGVCGSAATTRYATTVFPTYYYYDTTIESIDRSDTTAIGWFNIIKSEINNDRPIHYRISDHSIVCDGWRDTDSINQYHMNYGWGNSRSTWYVIDSLYCHWEPDSLCPCDEEYLVRYIQPAYEELLCDTLYDGNGGPLTSSGGPYLVTCDIIVPTGQTLTIQAGAEVYFESGKKITADGTLSVTGSSSSPIMLCSETTPHRGFKLMTAMKLQNGEELKPGQ